MNKVLVILGPTATGKTDVALHLAKKFKGELVACDSRQVYRGLDIGTGKFPSDKLKSDLIELKIKNLKFKIKKYDGYWLIDRIRVWMYDVVDLDKQYTAYDYVRKASQIIDNILKENKLPIIVGGTGFYLKALLEELDNLSSPINHELREELEKMDLGQLQQQLQQLSPNKWKKLNDSDRKNPRRLVRAIEILTDQENKKKKPNKKLTDWEVLKVGLHAPGEILYRKVDYRITFWFERGILDEVKKLMLQKISMERFKQLGLEYSLIAQFISGKIKSQTELINKIKGSLHNYLRRQQTWFKKQSGIFWFDITDKDYLTKIETAVDKWYDWEADATKD